ncbi:MAG: ribose-phosphate diphosphokinase, partial [Thermoplasmata archaeon]|nr:ribose-phosphate diphosphokinase [Thermoplasmata archaeon]
IHAKSILQWFTIPVEDVSGMPALAEKLMEEGVDMVLSPDKGAKGRASMVAGIIGCPWDYLEKTRLDGEHVVMKAKNLDVSGKVVAITDDIIATGGTMITAAGHLKEQGASRVIAACTHGLFTKNALPRLEEVFNRVISTDTLENPTSVVSVAGEIAKVL